MEKEIRIDSRYPSIDDLRKRAQKKIPKFAFEYLDGGCNEDVNLHKNTSQLREVELLPYYLNKHTKSVCAQSWSAEPIVRHLELHRSDYKA